MQRLAWLVAATAACGSVNKAKLDAPPPPVDAAIDAAPDPLNGAMSGTRLKIKWAQYQDGTKQFWTLHDNQLDTDCYPSSYVADAAHVYCVPQSTSVYYSDAACSAASRITFEYTTCGSQTYTYASESDYSMCPGGFSHVYAVGAMITPPANYYYKDSSGTCGLEGAPPTSATVYAVGAEINKTSLVEVTKSAPSAGAVGVVSYQSADGLSLPALLHDSTNNYDCSPNFQYGLSKAACFPTNEIYGGYYQDNACGTSVAYQQTSCPAPTGALTASYPKTGCPLDQPSVYQIGLPLTTQPTSVYYWDSSNQTCNMTGASSTSTYYSFGSAVTPPMLEINRDMLPGRRLQPNQFTSGSTRFRYFTGYDPIYDSTLGSYCYTQQMYDNTIKCIPNLSYIQTYYSDPGCTAQIQLANVYKGPAGSSCTSQPAPAFAYQSAMAGSCYTYDIYAAGSKYTGTVYVMSGTCVPYPQASQYDFYQIGPQVPLVGLASATLQTDP